MLVRALYAVKSLCNHSYRATMVPHRVKIQLHLYRKVSQDGRGRHWVHGAAKCAQGGGVVTSGYVLLIERCCIQSMLATSG